MSATRPTPRAASGHDDEPPRVIASLVRGRGVNQFRIRCPYSGRTHTHGAGRPHEDPRDYADHRVAHCKVMNEANSRGYILVFLTD